MTELLPTQLSPEKGSKEKTMLAYRKFVERGIKSPDELDPSDPEVVEATDLFEEWQKGLGDDGRANLEKTLFFVNIGFTDPNYLRDVLGWLFQDAEDLEKDPNNPELVQLRKEYADEMRKIRRMLQ